MRERFLISALSCLLLTALELPQKKKIKIFIAGDFTAANKEVKAFPETGWRMPFAYFFDSTVTVDNRQKMEEAHVHLFQKVFGGS